MTERPLDDLQVLVLFAHPDDESFAIAGSLTALREQGAKVTVVTATRGEAGQILIDEGIERDHLGAVREQELRNAMQELGITDVRFLEYTDSGMEGTPENEAPNAFSRVSSNRLNTDFLRLVDDLQPDVIFTFNEDGVYLHPDHIRVHEMVVDGLDELSRTNPSLLPLDVYFVSIPRSALQQVMDDLEGPFAEETDERKQRMGTPDERVTHEIDISPYVDKKRAAIMAHRTQTGDEEPFADVPSEFREAIFSREFFEHRQLREPKPNDHPDPLSQLNLR